MLLFYSVLIVTFNSFCPSYFNYKDSKIARLKYTKCGRKRVRVTNMWGLKC